MKNVNPYFLHKLLDPLTGLADDDEAVARFASLDPEDEQAVKGVIRELLVPRYDELSAEMKDRAKTALGYYLLKPGANLGRVFDSNLLPFDAPTDPRLFFVWLWEVLFAGEPVDVGELQSYREVPNANEPNRLAEEARRKQER